MRLTRISKEKKPARKSQRIGYEIQESDGNGDQVLPTLRDEIVRFQIETVEAAKNGLEIGFGGHWEDDLGSLLYVFLGDLWISTRRNYFDSLRKRDNFQEDNQMRTAQLKGK